MRVKSFQGPLAGILVLMFLSAVAFSQTPEATKVFEQSKEGILSLHVYGSNKELIAKGTGFSIADEVIVTAYHLVSSAALVEGTNAKGKKFKVEGIVSVDRNLNVAFLKIKGKVPVLALGNSDELENAKRVFTVGPNEAGEIVVSEGTVRIFHKLSDTLKVMELSLAVPETFAGGPLFNENGRVVGVNFVLDKTDKFGIPSNAWKNMPAQARTTEFKSWPAEDYFSLFEGAFLAGRLSSMAGGTSGALRYLEKAAKLKPSSIDVQALLADLYNRLRDYQAALTAYQRVIELDDKRADAHFHLGTILFRMKRWQDATASLGRAISLQPDNKEAYFSLGNTLEEIKDFAGAAAAYEKFVALKPPNVWMGYLRLGLARMELGQFEGAIQAFEEALQEQPQDVKVNFSLAQACQRSKQYEKAEETYKRLAQINPKEEASYYRIIMGMYDGAGNFGKAIEAARRLNDLNPKDETALYNMGIMYQKMEKYDLAVEKFRRVLEIKPNFDYAVFNIGSSYTKLNKHKEAVEAYKKYVELVPDSDVGWLSLAVAYMNLKDFENALEPLRKCLDLRPENGVALYNLAITYLNLKDNYSAREVYKTLNRVDPGLAEKLKKFLK